MSPLANQDPLAQLSDIIAPTSANAWPPAPIYWLLLALFIVAIVAALYFLKRIKKHREKQQRALLKLQQLQADNASFIALNQLLKGVALSYFPRQQVASLHSEQWFDFLQRYATTELFSGKERFLKYLYRYSEQPCSPDDFIQARKWIKQLPKQIKKHHKEIAHNV